jgi:hypothetical protein
MRAQQQIVTTMDEIRGRSTSRRGFLGGSARLAGGGAVALAAVSLPFLRGGGNALAAEDFADDLDVVQYALTLEHLEYAFYRDGLQQFSKADVDDVYPSNLYTFLEAVRNHEGTHVEQLIAVVNQLGGTPVEEAKCDFGYTDLDSFLNTAALLENTGVSAYAGAAPFIQDKAILAAALGIHSIEARHASYLNFRTGDPPAPVSNDVPMSKDDVLKAAGGFIVS